MLQETRHHSLAGLGVPGPLADGEVQLVRDLSKRRRDIVRKVPARRSLGAVVCRERLSDLPRTATIRISGFGIEALS